LDDFTIFNKSPNSKKQCPVSCQQADILYTVLPCLRYLQINWGRKTFY